jgi:hypothetical protein
MLIRESCPLCGYDLRGLPCPHACPECGEPYDEHTRGWRAMPSRWSLLAFLPILFVLWPFLMERLLGRVVVPAGVKIALVGTLGFSVAIAIAVWRGSRRGPAVAITPRGLFVRMHGGGTMIPWDDVGAITRWDRNTVVINRLDSFLPVYATGAFGSETEVSDFLNRVAEYRSLRHASKEENRRRIDRPDGT